MMPAEAQFDKMIHDCNHFIRGQAIRVALNAALVLAPTFAFAETSAPDPLVLLAGDVWAQFELAYRSQPAEYELRRVKFNAVIEAWRAAPDTAETDGLLANWMRAAIQASMPGSRTPLLPAPQFALASERRHPEPQRPLAGMELVKSQYDRPTTARTPIAGPVTTVVTDPFIDDPFFDDPVTK